MKAFARDDSGAWTCLHNIELQGPTGRIQIMAGSRFVPGTVFMNVDLPAWLDSQTRNGGVTARTTGSP